MRFHRTIVASPGHSAKITRNASRDVIKCNNLSAIADGQAPGVRSMLGEHVRFFVGVVVNASEWQAVAALHCADAAGGSVCRNPRDKGRV